MEHIKDVLKRMNTTDAPRTVTISKTGSVGMTAPPLLDEYANRYFNMSEKEAVAVQNHVKTMVKAAKAFAKAGISMRNTTRQIKTTFSCIDRFSSKFKWARQFHAYYKWLGYTVYKHKGEWQPPIKKRNKRLHKKLFGSK